jgi:sedoheptulose-bisphosphatase
LQGGGLFLNPIAASAPAKLRMLYECAPLAYIVEAAGGACTDGAQSLLDVPISALDARTAICLGSVSEVYRAQHCLHAAA